MSEVPVKIRHYRVYAAGPSPEEDQTDDLLGRTPECLLSAVRSLYLFPLGLGLVAMALSVIFRIYPRCTEVAAFGGTFMVAGLFLATFGAWMRQNLGIGSIRAWYIHCAMGLLLIALFGGVFVYGVYHSVLHRDLAFGSGFGASMFAVTSLLLCIHRRWTTPEMKEWMEQRSSSGVSGADG